MNTKLKGRALLLIGGILVLLGVIGNIYSMGRNLLNGISLRAIMVFLPPLLIMGVRIAAGIICLVGNNKKSSAGACMAMSIVLAVVVLLGSLFGPIINLAHGMPMEMLGRVLGSQIPTILLGLIGPLLCLVGAILNKKDSYQYADQGLAGWSCPVCGHGGNQTHFCNRCGYAKPEEEPAVVTAETVTPPAPAANGDSWICPACGAESSGRFCADCGSAKPEPKPADGPWVCACGTENVGKFCPNCGSKRPGI